MRWRERWWCRGRQKWCFCLRPDLSEEKVPTHYYRWFLMIFWKQRWFVTDFWWCLENFWKQRSTFVTILPFMMIFWKLLKAEVIYIYMWVSLAISDAFLTQRSTTTASQASQLGRSALRLSGDYTNQNGRWRWRCNFSVKGLKRSSLLSFSKMVKSTLILKRPSTKVGPEFGPLFIPWSQNFALFIPCSRPAGHVAK